MRIFSYRNRLRLRTLGKVLLALLVAVLLIFSAAYLYLQRYVVYTANGAYLDFSSTADAATTGGEPVNGELIVGDAVERQTPPVVISTEPSAEDSAEVETQLRGLYLDATTSYDSDAFLKAVDQTIDDADDGETVSIMLTLKNGDGVYSYSTGQSGAELSNTAVQTDQLIEDLKTRKVQLIARIPAFCDSAYALKNQPEGLAITGGALWLDSNGCYWLNPASDLAVEHLAALCQELKGLGFQEVAFSDFACPTSSSIVSNEDTTPDAVTAAAAEALSKADSSGILHGFLTDSTDAAFAGAAFASHIYLSLSDGASVSSVAGIYTGILTDPSLQLAFLTDSRDTRFEQYGILRPYTPDTAE